MLRSALKPREFQFNGQYVQGDSIIVDICSRTNNIEFSKGGPLMIDEHKFRIIKQYHGHLGRSSKYNMKFAISKRYKWVFMYNYIIKYYKSCETCQKKGWKKKYMEQDHKPRKTKSNLGSRSHRTGRVKGKKNFIFKAIDHFTKCVETNLLTNKRPFIIIKAMKKVISIKHDKPETILLDCEKNS